MDIVAHKVYVCVNNVHTHSTVENIVCGQYVSIITVIETFLSFANDACARTHTKMPCSRIVRVGVIGPHTLRTIQWPGWGAIALRVHVSFVHVNGQRIAMLSGRHICIMNGQEIAFYLSSLLDLAQQNPLQMTLNDRPERPGSRLHVDRLSIDPLDVGCIPVRFGRSNKTAVSG